MVTVKHICGPAQLFNVGITHIVPVILAPVLLAGAVHVAIFPALLATRPMAVFELAHVKVAPEGTLTKAGIEIDEPGHTAILEIAFTVGVG